MTTSNTSTQLTEPVAVPPVDATLGPSVRRAVARRRFATLATASAAGRPHSAGVLYGLAEGSLWISTMRDSVKARNVAETGRAAATIAVRRVPLGPPSSVSLQAVADVVDLGDDDLHRLAEAGLLDSVTSHGELELDGGCFLRLALPRRVPVYGLGMSLVALARDPLAAGRVTDVDWTA